MNRNKNCFVILMFLLSFRHFLFAQNIAEVRILPFTGETEAAAVFDGAVAQAVTDLKIYNPRQISADTVREAGLRIPTDMPPVKELVPGARFALTGGVYPGSDDDEYYLQLWLWDMDNSTMIYTDDLVYRDINNALETLPGLVEWLFSHITEVTETPVTVPQKIWEDKRITAGLRAGVSQRWYGTPGEITPGAFSLNFEGGIFATVYLFSRLSFQAEIDLSIDNFINRGISSADDKYIPVFSNEKFTAYSLTFPLLVKTQFLPANNLRLAPFGGLYAFLPLGDASYRLHPSGESGNFSWSADLPLGFILGLEAATRFGPGIIIADIRYSADFGTVVIHDDGFVWFEERNYSRFGDTRYSRGMLSITFGYAFGFINVKK